ncbi:hypothetical protein C0416_05220 [bacterium]|nr:hypothetical protein [bacterium]
MDQKNPKKMGKMGVTVAALLVFAAGGLTFFGGQSEWLQGALHKLTFFQKSPAIQTQVQTKNKDVVVDGRVLQDLPDLSPAKVATIKDFVVPAKVALGSQDQVVYSFKVDKVGGLKKVAKLGLEVDGQKYDTDKLDLRLWESKDGVKTEFGLLSDKLITESVFSTDALYIITADLPASFAGKALTVSLLSDGALIPNSSQTLEIATLEVTN